MSKNISIRFRTNIYTPDVITNRFIDIVNEDLKINILHRVEFEFSMRSIRKPAVCVRFNNRTMYIFSLMKCVINHIENEDTDSFHTNNDL